MARTVFVIGAGASLEFGEGMPVGPQLAEQIEELMSKEIKGRYEGPISNAIMRTGGFGTPHQLAVQRVHQGIVTKESIDDFIDEWKDVPQLPEIAKLGIAHSLLIGEGKTIWGLAAKGSISKVDALRRTRDSWLGRILRMHNREHARREFPTAMADVAFVVFNYDRLIEYHLYAHLTVALGVPPSEAQLMLNSFPIIHVYGPIGVIPELGGRQKFGSSEPQILAHSASMIRTYTEAVESVTGDRIAGLMANAEKVVFLGAAYHEQNLRLLFPDSTILSSKAGPKLFGTTYKMRANRVALLLKRFENPYVGREFLSMEAGQFIDQVQDDLFG